MFSNVLLICVGNICRSPMAAALLHQRLPDAAVQIASAGIAAVRGAGLEPMAQAVLQRHGVPCGAHRARQVDQQMLHQAGLILVMEPGQAQYVLTLAPEVRGKTFLLGKWQHAQPIADPYRRPQAAFEQTYEQLSRCVDDWLPYLPSGATS